MLKKLFAVVLTLTLIFGLSLMAIAATEEEIEKAIEKGVVWLVDQQNADDGSWGCQDQVARTGLAVLKLEDRAFELGYEYPFEGYDYEQEVMDGLYYIFTQAASHLAGGICFAIGWGETYNTAIAMMAIAASGAPDAEVNVGNPAVDDMTYKEVLQANVKFFALTQNLDGGWRYWAEDQSSDNSNSGWVTLGLAFAESPAYGFECVIPDSVRIGLDSWIDYVQDDVGDPPGADPNDGGSWYCPGDDWAWVNILKTGNLLQQMAFYGDTVGTQRVQDAVDYLVRHWDDNNDDPGWRGWSGQPAAYQATFTVMKGLESFGIGEIGDPPIDWFDEISTVLVEQQNDDGSWPFTLWDSDWCWPEKPEPVLSTAWALLTLEKVVPPPAIITVAVDIKPQSCPNPLNPKSKGVLPAAILGTEDFDVTQADPASVLLEGVAPLRWNLEDVATPFEGEKEGAYDCTEEGPDGFLDLTLKFNAQEVVQAVEGELGRELEDGEVLILTLTANLMNGSQVSGEDVMIVRAKGKKAPAAPLAFAALAPYPNPLNPETWIPYRLAEDIEMTITIYNASGQLIRILDLGYQQAGSYISKSKAAYWDGRNSNGEAVSSGIYFYRIEAGDFSAIRKMIVVR